MRKVYNNAWGCMKKHICRILCSMVFVALLSGSYPIVACDKLQDILTSEDSDSSSSTSSSTSDSSNNIDSDASDDDGYSSDSESD